MLTRFSWISMGYPMKKEVKIRLIFLFYEILCECDKREQSVGEGHLHSSYPRP